MLTINLPRADWRDQRSVDAMLIHECAHERADDHLTSAFYNECCRLGVEFARGKASKVRWTVGQKAVA